MGQKSRRPGTRTPFVQVPLLFFSQIGGGTVAGAYLMLLGFMLLRGRTGSRRG